MNFWINLSLVGAAVATGAGLTATAQARAGDRVGWPDPYKDMRSIGDVIGMAKGNRQTVHIFYVHGMRAVESGASQALVDRLLHAPALGGTPVANTIRVPIDLGEGLRKRPAKAQTAGRLIWGCDEDDTACRQRKLDWDEAWQRSLPFVMETKITGSDPEIVVHEVNWWPLVMALKCRFLVVPEADLSGDARKDLRRCAQDVSREDAKFDAYFPWIDAKDAEALIKARPRSGGGAALNGWVKRTMINWGLADAVIALGPMKEYLRKTLDVAAARVPKGGSNHQILIAESLGGFIAMDASRDGPTRELVERTRDFYFLANQFALLELGRISGLKTQSAAGISAASDVVAAEPSPLMILQGIVTSPSAVKDVRPAQIVAVNDPSDMLTYSVPPLCGIKVANLYWRFSGGPLRLLAHPLKAHTGGVANRRLWKMLLTPNGVSGGLAKPCSEK